MAKGLPLFTLKLMLDINNYGECYHIYRNCKDMKTNGTCRTLPETPSRGWGLIPEMIQVCDYDILIVLVELNTLIYVRPLNEWQSLELGHFEVGNFGQTLALFSTTMFFFSQLGSPRAAFNLLNES